MFLKCITNYEVSSNPLAQNNNLLTKQKSWPSWEAAKDQFHVYNTILYGLATSSVIVL